MTIREKLNEKIKRYRFQFENAVHYAGIRAQSRTGLSNCYIQCYSSWSEKEKPLVVSAGKIPCDDKGNIYKSAVKIDFADGSYDIVIWQPYSEMTSWGTKQFDTDARAALIRLDKKGKVKFVSRAGGTELVWQGSPIVKEGKGTLRGRLHRIIGDISGDYGKSVLVLKGASDWPEGEELKGQTVIAGYNRGARREVYTIDRIERKNDETCIYLENAPFFIDHRGEVKNDKRSLGNRFCGTGTAKGGAVTHYLSGSKVVFPELNKSFTLDLNAPGGLWILRENVNLIREGIKKGIRFEIHPDWENAIVELVTAEEKDMAAETD